MRDTTAAMAFLRVIQESEERTLDLEGEPISIGRSPGNQVVVPNPKVSRFHCRIERTGSGYKLVDLGSRNGIRVNDEFVQQKLLQAGDQIRLGGLTLVYEPGSSDRSLAPPPPSRPRARVASSLSSPPPRARTSEAPRTLRPSQATPSRSTPEATRNPRLHASSSSSLAPRVVAIFGVMVIVGIGGLIWSGWEEPQENPVTLVSNSEDPLASTTSDANGGDSSRVDSSGIDSRGEDSAGSDSSSDRPAADSHLEGEVSQDSIREPAPSASGRTEGVSTFDPRTEIGRPPTRDSFATSSRESDTSAAKKREGRLAAGPQFDEPVDETAGLADDWESYWAEDEDDSLGDPAIASASDAGLPEGSPELEALYRDAIVAERLGQSLDFEAAIDELKRIVSLCEVDEARAEFTDRIEWLGRQRDLLAHLIEWIGDGSGFVSRVKVRRLGRLRGADSRVLRCDRGEIPWKEMRSDDFVRLCEKVSLPAVHLLAAASYAFDAEDEEIAHTFLLRAVEWEPEYKLEVDVFLSQRTGVPVPDGGFVAFEGKLITPERRDSVLRLRQVDGYLVKLGSTKPDQLLEGILGLGEMGGPGAVKGARYLAARRSVLGRELTGHRLTSLLGKLRQEKEEVDRRRKAALELIFDTERYPFPFKAPEAPPQVRRVYYETQSEIDDRVRELRELYDDPPTSRTVVLSKEYLNHLQLFQLCERGLDVFGEEEVEPLDGYEYLSYLIPDVKAVHVQRFFLEERERERYLYNQRVLAWNAGLEIDATRAEKSQVSITNEYRMLMGRRALVLHEQLLVAARGHSREMSREGYFGHISPFPERSTPEKRCRLEGYEGSNVGENCTQGISSPSEAHDAWLHSSGHHRNILGPDWTEMGAGKSGGYWTQNFGKGEPLRADEGE